MVAACASDAGASGTAASETSAFLHNFPVHLMDLPVVAEEVGMTQDLLGRTRRTGSRRVSPQKRHGMKLNTVERLAMNNALRAAHQHRREADWFRRLSAGGLQDQHVLEVGCGPGVGVGEILTGWALGR